MGQILQGAAQEGDQFVAVGDGIPQRQQEDVGHVEGGEEVPVALAEETELLPPGIKGVVLLGADTGEQTGQRTAGIGLEGQILR